MIEFSNISKLSLIHLLYSTWFMIYFKNSSYEIFVWLSPDSFSFIDFFIDYSPSSSELSRSLFYVIFSFLEPFGRPEHCERMYSRQFF